MSATAPSSLELPASLSLFSCRPARWEEAGRQAAAYEGGLPANPWPGFPHFPQDFHSRSCHETPTCCPPGPPPLSARNPSWGKIDSHPRLTYCCRCCDAREARATRAFSSQALPMKEVWELEQGVETTRPNGLRRSAGWSSLREYRVHKRESVEYSYQMILQDL